MSGRDKRDARRVHLMRGEPFLLIMGRAGRKIIGGVVIGRVQEERTRGSDTMQTFLSYSRSDASVEEAVAKDVKFMGHEVWYDREVAGGQAWWNEILQQIRECDLFIFILTPRSLESQACRAEYTYASRLQKRILPVLCHDGVKVNLLPPELSQIQFVDYRAQDKQAAFGMVKAFNGVPEAVPLPDPLPSEPPVPISYLGDLRAQIDSDKALTLAQQRELFFEVKRRLKDSESRDDALELLRLLRGREDLLASVAEEIDTALDHSPQERPHEPSEDRALAEDTVVADLPPSAIDLTGDSKGLEPLVRNVAANSERWVLKSGGDSVFVYLENGELVLAASFHRWTEKDMKSLKGMGWSQTGKIIQIAILTAFYVFAALTTGLGLLLLLHKETREYLIRNLAVKRFSLSQEREAVMNIVEAFRTLCPDVTRVDVSKAGALPGNLTGV